MMEHAISSVPFTFAAHQVAQRSWNAASKVMHWATCKAVPGMIMGATSFESILREQKPCIRTVCADNLEECSSVSTHYGYTQVIPASLTKYIPCYSRCSCFPLPR